MHTVESNTCWETSSQLDFSPRDLKPDHGHEILLETLPPCAVQMVAQLPIVVHLSPAIASPLTPSHIDEEIPPLFIVMNVGIVSIVAACAGRKGINFPLWDESCVRPDPGMRGVEELESVLFFVLPFHVFLLVANRVPPDVEESVGP